MVPPEAAPGLACKVVLLVSGKVLGGPTLLGVYFCCALDMVFELDSEACPGECVTVHRLIVAHKGILMGVSGGCPRIALRASA
jgi:hypothetical protein